MFLLTLKKSAVRNGASISNKKSISDGDVLVGSVDIRSLSSPFVEKLLSGMKSYGTKEEAIASCVLSH